MDLFLWVHLSHPSVQETQHVSSSLASPASSPHQMTHHIAEASLEIALVLCLSTSSAMVLLLQLLMINLYSNQGWSCSAEVWSCSVEGL